MYKHRIDLGEELQLMGVHGINAFHVQGQFNVQSSAQGSSTTGPSASPALLPPRNDYNIMFIDPYNEARSVVAEGYTKLLRGWTEGTGGDWRINIVHFAGFFVRSRGELHRMIENMNYLYPSFKLPMAEGNAKANPIALAALFDNKMFGYPFKQSVKDQMEFRSSRGIPGTIFKTYDYIFVFTNREHDNLVRLQRALIALHGKQAVTGGGKGRIVHLGNYRFGQLKEKPAEILAPKGDEDRAKWNVQVGQIKGAIKVSLKQEMGWEQP